MRAPSKSSRKRQNRRPSSYRLRLEPLESRMLLAAFVVDSTQDLSDFNPGDGICATAVSGGVCTLRGAIQEANAFANGGAPDTISFNIPGAGPHTINVGDTGLGALPPISQPVVIDGDTQPGASCNTNDRSPGSNAVLLIELNGTEAGFGVSGLRIMAGGSTVRGLVINSFLDEGIELSGGGTLVECSYIGTDTTGTVDLGQLNRGILILSSNNTVGGTTAAARNLISGNGGSAISVVGLNNLIQGNLIGTDAAGVASLRNSLNGVSIGTGANNNTIGGTVSGAGNTIAFNGIGVSISDGTTGNTILGNSMFLNSGLGIDLARTGPNIPQDPGDVDVGANKLQNFPELASAQLVGGMLSISYSVPSATPHSTFPLRVEFFRADSAGEEGQAFLGSDSYAAGAGNKMVSFTPPTTISPGKQVVATATDAAGNTSEFSLNVIVSGACSLLVDTTSDAEDAGDGVTSLREAINCANSDPDLSTITFGIPGTGVHMITPATDLPTILRPVVIDGESQSGASCNTADPGVASNTVLRIELNGTAAGAAANGLNVTAGGSTVRGLVINRFGGSGIRLATGDGNLVECNFIGTNVAGTAGLGNNADGVFVGSDNNTIGGVTNTARNVISGNISFAGVNLRGGTGNLIAGNFIGTNAAGTGGLRAFSDGITISDGVDNTIGGTVAGARNIISGNGRGVLITGSDSTGNVVQGNFIGTDLTGTADLGNEFEGIEIDFSSRNTIGGTASGARNVISGNDSDGVKIGAGSVENIVQGNFIGTDVTGTVDLGNDNDGVAIASASKANTIGGTAAGAGNLISGNGAGVRMTGTFTTDNLVLGNFIGTDVTGALPLGNGDGVVLALQTNRNTVGGTAAGARNVVSGSTRHGVSIESGANNNQVQGNFIGRNAAGTGNVPNNEGVEIINSPNNLIGGTTAAAGNVIAGNGNGGVVVFGNASTGNAIRGNSIFSNNGLGIDLVGPTDPANGVTVNDPGDTDSGPNKLLNFPEIDSFIVDGGMLSVTYSVPSDPANSTYPLRVEFFRADAGGQDGQAFLGFDVYIAAEAGMEKTVSFAPAAAITDRDAIVATATDDDGNTSEFSARVVIANPWHNAARPLDVRGGSSVTPDNFVDAGDALAIINYINTFGSTAVPDDAQLGLPHGFLDTNNDDSVAAEDALSVINAINSGQGGEGESRQQPGASSQQPISSDQNAVDSQNALNELIALLVLDNLAHSVQRRR